MSFLEPPDPVNRAWRGPPPVPRFAMARGSGASAAPIVAGLVIGAASFAISDALLARAGAGFAGQVLATGISALPAGAAIAHSSGRDFHAALKSGCWFAFASAAVYAWAFGGGWI